MRRLRKVLYPTRFDPLAFARVEMLYPLKDAGLEEVVLLFVVDRDEVGFIPYGGFDKDAAEDLADRARLRFADWGRDVEKAGLRCRYLVEVGRPAAKILEVAEREDADLIVTGRERRLPFDAVYLGGTAMELLRRSRLPVLVGKVPDDGDLAGAPLDPYAHALFATDFSPDSAPALEVLEGLRGAVEHVDVLHVLGPADLERLGEAEIREEEKARGQRLQAVCAELSGAGLSADWHLRAGKVSDEILGALADRRCTFVVLGTTAKEGLRELWLGSVSHRVAELSPVPVLLVPARPASP